VTEQGFDCDDPRTWRHRREKIDLPGLLELIEKNGGPWGLDLRGCDMSGVDARPETLRPHIASYLIEHGPDATFPWLTDKRGINLRGAHLEYAELPGARLEAADLRAARLKNANLSGAHLEHAYLTAAHLEHANLSAAHLEHAALLGAHLEDAHAPDVHLEHAELLGAHLQDAHAPDAHLEHAELLGAHLERAYLHGAHLQDTCLSGLHLEYSQLVHAHLQNADLSFAYLQNADLRYAQLHGVTWYSAHLDRTRLHRDELGPAIADELAAKGQARHSEWFVEAREAYMTLKTNFDSIGRYEDASWAYVKEQQMEKAMYLPTTMGHRWIRRNVRRAHRRWLQRKPGRLARLLRGSILGRLYRPWLHIRLFVGHCPREVKQEMARLDESGEQRDEWLSRRRWARNWAYELLTGYGERPILPLLWAAVLSILAFPLLYWTTGALPGHARAFTSATPSNIDWAGWGDSIIFSMTSFATLAFNRLQPDGALANILAASEAATGVLAFALFVFTLGNRMRRS
jgi:uncharacterized protein YjbI with pentapeptide repeats